MSSFVRYRTLSHPKKTNSVHRQIAGYRWVKIEIGIEMRIALLHGYPLNLCAGVLDIVWAAHVQQKNERGCKDLPVCIHE